jgi:quinol monooxygenase YgiN
MATPPNVSAVRPSAVTLITQTRVSPSHDEEFARWQEQVNHALAHFPGYLHHTVLPPHPPAQVDWVVVQRFTSHEAARAWLQSEQRLRLLHTIQPLLVGQDDLHLFADDSEPNCPRLSRPSSPYACSQGKKNDESARSSRLSASVAGRRSTALSHR